MQLKHTRLSVLGIDERPNCWPSFWRAFPLFNRQLGNRTMQSKRSRVDPDGGDSARSTRLLVDRSPRQGTRKGPAARLRYLDVVPMADCCQGQQPAQGCLDMASSLRTGGQWIAGIVTSGRKLRLEQKLHGVLSRANLVRSRVPGPDWSTGAS